MFRWVDNNIVKMVSNIHIGEKDESVMEPRKKPSINDFNRKHIRLVWEDDHIVTVKRLYKVSTIIITGCLVLI